MKTQQKARMSIILPSKLVEEVKNFSVNNDVPQSFVIEKALASWLKEKLEKDTKELAKIKFDDLPSEEDWTSIQSDLG